MRSLQTRALAPALIAAALAPAALSAGGAGARPVHAAPAALSARGADARPVHAATALSARGADARPVHAATALSARGADARPVHAAPAALSARGADARPVHAAATALSVSPQPGTPDASATTQISILGASPSDLGTIRVTGSRSGAHSGKLEPYDSARGASFVPDRPFLGGEVVHVGIRGPAATTHLSFTVARAATSPSRPGSPGPPTHHAAFSFVTRPDLFPPRIAMTRRAGAAAPGDLFLAPIVAPGRIDVRTGLPEPQKTRPPMFGQYGPALYDSRGELVWSRPAAPGAAAFDFRAQTYAGKPVLTWWEGKVTPVGTGAGVDYIVDQSYRQVAAVKAGNGYAADIHEFAIGPGDTAWVTAYAPVAADLSSAGGARDGALVDSIVQEIDVHTGLVMFEWHAAGHVPLTDSHSKPVPGVPWDAYHVNSIQPLASGGVIVSARQTWAVYDVSSRTGRILWTLGGRHTTYRLGPGAQFAWQHDAQLHRGGTLSLFDDEAAPEVGSASRGLLLELDARRRTATVVREYRHSKPAILASSQGNTSVLPNGDVFVGWGSAPYFTEYSADGTVVLDGHLHGADESYRAYRSAWVGTPGYPPVAAAKPRSGGGATVYASWNGATEVARWQVLAGPVQDALLPTGAPVARAGFETSIPTSASGPYFAVEALDSAGDVIETSQAVRAGG